MSNELSHVAILPWALRICSVGLSCLVTLHANVGLTSTAEAQTGAGALKKPMTCDLILGSPFSPTSFESLQGQLNSNADNNGDGARVLCIRGLILNDETAGDLNRTLSTGHPGLKILRGLDWNGERAVIRKVVTSPVIADSVANFEAPNIIIENIRFEHAVTSASTLPQTLQFIGGTSRLSDVAVDIDAAQGGFSSAVFLSGDAELRNLSVDLRGAPTMKAVNINQHNIALIDGLTVLGDGTSGLLHLDDGIRIGTLKNVYATGLSEGLWLTSYNVINYIENAYIEGSGPALTMTHGSRIGTIDDLRIVGCGMNISDFGSISGANSFSIIPGANC